MNNKIWIGVVIAAIVIIVGAMIYSAQPVVSAEGSSSIKVVPDKVSVNINVEGKGVNLSAANQKAQDISQFLLINLVQIGYDRDELKFVNYNSYEDFDWSSGKQKLLGWVVSEQLVVNTNDASKVLSIIDAAISADAQISYINFEVSDAKQKEVKAEALKQASEDAKTKAAAIASGQGKGLGKLVSLENLEVPSFYPYPMYAKSDMATIDAGNMEARTMAVNLAPNEQEITASVKASYKLGLF
jgi:uncharacterized protein YggE